MASTCSSSLGLFLSLFSSRARFSYHSDCSTVDFASETHATTLFENITKQYSRFMSRLELFQIHQSF